MKKNNTKDAQKTIEAMKAELEAKTRRLEAFEDIMKVIEERIHSEMRPRVAKESWTETWTDEETGEEKTKYHWTEFEEDENGNTLYDAPTEDDWHYPKYVSLCSVRDEILALL